jgi:hypothetical protein
MAKKISALVLGVFYLFLSSGLALADTRPYFRAYGSDTFAGGWFNSGASSCSPAASTFQAPTYLGLTNLYKGGVLGYGKSDGSGAGSQFGSLALGMIQGPTGSGEPYGFTSGSNGYNKLSFANFTSLSATGYWGGFWEGSDAHQASHCTTDYFGTKQNSPKPWGGSLGAAASGQYLATGLTLNTSPEVVSAGKNITLFVNGNVYIASNITYAAGYTADNVPKFALVVHGDIFIDPAVSRLDGLYIAQPDLSVANPVTADTGVIWTCHANAADPPTAVYVSSACRSKLTFNGAVIAKQVNLLRVNGDVASAAAGEGSISGNIAEVFNFTPEMVIGGGFFNSPVGGKYKIESLISLPPVF